MSGKSRLTEKQCKSTLFILRLLRFPVLVALVLVNVEFVRVAMAHLQARSAQAALHATDQGDRAKTPVDAAGEAVTTVDPADGSPLTAQPDNSDNGSTNPGATDRGGSRVGDAGEESENSDGSENGAPAGQKHHVAGAERPEVDEDEPERSQEESAENDRRVALTAVQLEEAAAQRQQIADDLSVTLVDLIQSLVSVRGSTKQAIGIFTDDVRTILDRLSQFPIEKLHAPLPTVEEVNTRAGQHGTQAATESDDQTPPEPTPAVQPPPSIERAAAAIELVLVNPRDSGVQVRFLVNDVLHELLPGEMRRLESYERWHVQFHRGGNFGDADYMLSGGRYEFQAAEEGWQLVKIADPATDAAR